MNIAKNGSIEGNLFYYVQWMNQQYTHTHIYIFARFAIKTF